jgi:hypothetical protein
MLCTVWIPPPLGAIEGQIESSGSPATARPSSTLFAKKWQKKWATHSSFSAENAVPVY